MAAMESILALDIGSAVTHLCLLDRVGGRHRLVGVAQVPTSLGRLGDGVYVGVLRGIRRLEHVSRRPLIGAEGDLAIPADDDQAGVDGCFACCSAAPPLCCALVGLTDALSMAGARKAIGWAAAAIVAEVVLGAGAPVERAMALAKLRTVAPDAIVLVGGRDGGDTTLLVSAAEMISVLYADAARHERPAVLFAGNRAAGDGVVARLGAAFACTAVDNVLSMEGEPAPWPLQRAIRDLYGASLALVPGLGRIARWCSAPVLASHEAFGVTMQTLACRNAHGQTLLGLDVGASGATIGWVQHDGYRQARLLYADLVSDATPGERESRLDAVWRRHSGVTSSEDARSRLENARLRPWSVSETQEDLELSLAAACWAIEGATASVGWVPQARPEGRLPAYDVAVRGVAIAGCPREVVVSQAISQSLRLPGDIRLISDWASIWPQLGVVARAAPAAAADVLELDATRGAATAAAAWRPPTTVRVG